MEHVERLVGWLNEDPQLLPGAPSSQEILETAGDPLLRKLDRELTPGERHGFLEMWQRAQMNTLVKEMSSEELALTELSAKDELYSGIAPERRALDLRFILTKVIAEKTTR